MRHLLRMLVMLVTASSVLVVGDQVGAGAFPAPDLQDYCEDDRWYVEISGYSASVADDIFDAISEWETALNPNGSAKLDIRDSTSGWSGFKEIALLPVNLASGVAGFALCDPDDSINQLLGVDGRIEINDDFLVGQLDFVLDVARHEFGHLMGLTHTGEEDSHDDNAATMSTCFSTTDTSRVYAQDDEEALFHKQDGAFPNPMMANRGFEDGAKTYWGNTGGSWWIHDSGNQAGDHHLRWTPTNSSKYIYQTASFDSGFTHDVGAAAHFKKFLSSATGDVTVEAYSRKVTWTSYANQCGPAPGPWLAGTGTFQNERASEGSWVLEDSASFTPTTSWANGSTSAEAVPSAEEDRDWRIRIYSSVADGGVMKTVAIDTARLFDSPD